MFCSFWRTPIRAHETTNHRLVGTPNDLLGLDSRGRSDSNLGCACRSFTGYRSTDGFLGRLPAINGCALQAQKVKASELG